MKVHVRIEIIFKNKSRLVRACGGGLPYRGRACDFRVRFIFFRSTCVCECVYTCTFTLRVCRDTGFRYVYRTIRTYAVVNWFFILAVGYTPSPPSTGHLPPHDRAT